jgi:TrpR family trp operon transcriptional repressor
LTFFRFLQIMFCNCMGLCCLLSFKTCETRSMKSRKKEIDEENLMELSEALSELRSPKDVRRFLGEICTDSECRDIARRWHLMKYLAEGVPQRKIARTLNLSLCKITRGSKYIKDETSLFRNAVLKAMGKNGKAKT